MTVTVRDPQSFTQGRVWRGMLLALVAVALSACSSDNMNDLRQ